MTTPPHFDQRNQSVDNQTNIDHADKVIIQASSSASVLPLPQQIPPPPRDFTGREDDIKELLEQFGQGATISGLGGMGGVGKTALALVFADRFKDRFPDGQLFLNMLGTSKSPLDPEDVMAHVIRSYLGIDASLPEQSNGLSGLYQSVLSGKRVLILLDNAASREQVEPLLPPPFCALLVTSRKKFALPGLLEKNLDVMPLQDAKKLLLEICGRIVDHAEELAKLCGCLPIALRNAAYVLKEKPNLSPEDYIERLGDASKRLELVDASFSTSYELLTPELQRLWSMLSVFPADFDLGGAAAVWEMEKKPTEYALGDLIKWSLVDFLPSATGEAGRYRLHDLARDFADSRLDDAASERARLHHASHYKDVLTQANVRYLQGREAVLAGLRQLDIDLVNIKAGHAWAERKFLKGWILKPAKKEVMRLVSEYSNQFEVLDFRLDAREKIRWLIIGKNASRRIKDKTIERNHLSNLGIAYKNLENIKEAIKCISQALTIDRYIQNKIGECDDMGNLGNVYRNMGNIQVAFKYHMQALNIAKEINDRKGEALSIGNIGNDYYSLGSKCATMGDANGVLYNSQEAIKSYEQSLVISRELGDRKSESNWLGNLGSANGILGRTTKAIEFFGQALVIAQELGYKSGESKNLGNLGAAYLDQGDYQIAIEFLEKSLAITHKIGDKRGEGIALWHMCIALERIGKKDHAIDCAKLAQVIFEQIESPYAETVRKKLAEWGA